MNTLDTALELTKELFTLIGYNVSHAKISLIDDVDISVIHITLDKNLKEHALDELTLNSQYLIRHMIAHKLSIPEEQATVSIDINGHLMEMIEGLRLKARIYADRAITFGVPVRMDPLPAFHRRIVHSILQKTQGITTESFGVGRERHIVISPEEKDSKLSI